MRSVPAVSATWSGGFFRIFVLGLASLVAIGAHAAAPASDHARAAALVAKMTLPEKVAQLQSAAPAIPRLGIPAYDWWSEGLHGIARNGYATVFPQAIGLAASWNPGLLQQVGRTVRVRQVPNLVHDQQLGARVLA